MPAESDREVPCFCGAYGLVEEDRQTVEKSLNKQIG